MDRKISVKNLPIIYDLVDLAIIPAALMICSKVVAIAGLNYLLDLDWGVQSAENVLFSMGLTYTNMDHAILVNSYSNLFMFVSVIAGCILVTSKSLLFNRKKASPYFLLKLAKYDLLHLLKSSFTIYKEAFVWGTFLIVTTVYIVISFLFGMTYAWVAGLSILFSLTFLWIMIQNIEEDILFNNYK